MADEEELMRVKNTQDQEQEMIEEEAEKNRLLRDHKREALWKETKMERAVEKEQLIQRLEEMAKFRGGKKKKKRGGKKNRK